MKPLYSNATQIAFRGKHAFCIGRLMHPTFNRKQRLYNLQNSNEFKCKGSRFIHHKFSRKKKNKKKKQMLFILFTCLNVGNDLNFAFSL